MKTRSFFSALLLAAGIALGVTGCAQQPMIGSSHVPSSRPAKTFALSVTLPDGSQLTPAQWAAVKSAFEQQLAAAGCTLVDDLSLADRIIRVVYTPAEDDPANGNAMVLSVRPNPVYAFNTPVRLIPASYSSNGFGLGFNSYNSGLYGYGYGYDYPYNYSGGSSTVTPRVDAPHHHNRPNQPDDCQPGQDHSHSTGQFASNNGNSSGGNSTSPGHHWGGENNNHYSSSGSRSSDYGSSSNYSSGSSSSGSSSYAGPAASYSAPSSPSVSFSSGSSSSSSSSSSYSAPSASYSSSPSSFSEVSAQPSSSSNQAQR